MAEKNTDRELIAGIRNPETCNFYFNQLVIKYQERLYYHIRRMVIVHDDADDILQQVFIKVWKGIHNFREDAKLYSWLYRIATNECITHLNNKKKRFFLPIHDVENELFSYLEQDSLFSGDEIQLKLQKAILTLPAKQRIVFNLKYFDELKYEEIAEILQTSVGALKASYHHASKKIEDFLLNH